MKNCPSLRTNKLYFWECMYILTINKLYYECYFYITILRSSTSRPMPFSPLSTIKHRGRYKIPAKRCAGTGKYINLQMAKVMLLVRRETRLRSCLQQAWKASNTLLVSNKWICQKRYAFFFAWRSGAFSPQNHEYYIFQLRWLFTGAALSLLITNYK